MLYKRIKAPKFRVGRYVLNEYELRELIAQVAEGTVDPQNITVKAEGMTATIDKDGSLSCNFQGLALTSGLVQRLYRAQVK